MRDVVLVLCHRSGIWRKLYGDVYEVVQVDIADGQDVRLLQFSRRRVRGVIAEPPCTHLTGSGAQWWPKKGPAALLEALQLVDACLRAVVIYQPDWWVLENPSGRLSKFIGPPAYTFHPCHYGDPYTKLTCLWGHFTMPQKNPVPATEGSKMHTRVRDAAARAVTASGFAHAFRIANP